jgi:hypothetical protein
MQMSSPRIPRSRHRDEGFDMIDRIGLSRVLPRACPVTNHCDVPRWFIRAVPSTIMLYNDWSERTGKTRKATRQNNEILLLLLILLLIFFLILLLFLVFLS